MALQVDSIFKSTYLGLGSIEWHHRINPISSVLWRCAIFHEIRHHHDAVAILALRLVVKSELTSLPAAPGGLSEGES